MPPKTEMNSFRINDYEEHVWPVMSENVFSKIANEKGFSYYNGQISSHHFYSEEKFPCQLLSVFGINEILSEK